jgi:hypothetical protein
VVVDARSRKPNKTTRWSEQRSALTARIGRRKIDAEVQRAGRTARPDKAGGNSYLEEWRSEEEEEVRQVPLDTLRGDSGYCNAVRVGGKGKRGTQ